jgi:hypothetical protein
MKFNKKVSKEETSKPIQSREKPTRGYAISCSANENPFLINVHRLIIKTYKESFLCNRYINDNYVFNLYAPRVLYIGQAFRTLQRTFFIYLINKYI